MMPICQYLVDGSDHMLPNKIIDTIKHKFCDIKLMPPNSTKNKKIWLYCTSQTDTNKSWKSKGCLVGGVKV
jgi:hypothetical protein